jgi:hypothetical protein
MSRDVLAIIAVGSHELTLEIIERAQDRVFDEATDPQWSGLSQANRCVAYS